MNHLSKFSDWSRAVRAVARLNRFFREFKKLQPRTNKATCLEDRREALIFIIKLVQEEAFAQDIKKIQQQKTNSLNKQNKLHHLNAFLDKNSVLRVGGRLTRSAWHYDVKHPAILPKKSHISSMIVKHHHERVQHQGRGLTMDQGKSSSA